jgi:hypothetical protein
MLHPQRSAIAERRESDVAAARLRDRIALLLAMLHPQRSAIVLSPFLPPAIWSNSRSWRSPPEQKLSDLLQ